MLLLSLLLHAAAGAATQPRIIGGTEATPFQYPFVISLHRGSSGSFASHICGGTLINNDWVVTAAHCIDPDASPRDYSIGINRHDLSKTPQQDNSTCAEVIQPSRLECFSGYDKNSMEGDICLIELSRSVRCTTTARPLLPDHFPMNGGTTLTIAGWGDIDESPSGQRWPDKLQHATVPLMTDSQCTRYLGSAFYPRSMFCAALVEGGRDTCQGDSGGPIFAAGPPAVLIGVVSWGYGCAVARSPGVYARVSNYLGWIRTLVAPAPPRSPAPPPPPPRPPLPPRPPPSPRPPPIPPRHPALTCGNSCQYASDSECDDGGPGAQYAACTLATDCADCGVRDPPEGGSPGSCTDSCIHAFDDDCDDGGPGAEYNACAPGTDCGDCSADPGNASPPAPSWSPGWTSPSGVTVSGPCGVVNGCLLSPNHPGTYDANTQCLFQNVPPSPLVVASFDVEGGAGCPNDYLLVNGMRYCGSSGPENVVVRPDDTIISPRPSPDPFSAEPNNLILVVGDDNDSADPNSVLQPSGGIIVWSANDAGSGHGFRICFASSAPPASSFPPLSSPLRSPSPAPSRAPPARSPPMHARFPPPAPSRSPPSEGSPSPTPTLSPPSGGHGGPPTPLVSPDPSFTLTSFSESMALTAMVTIDGALATAGALYAFVGTAQRGVQDVSSTPPFGPYAGTAMFQMTIGADVAGETLDFYFQGFFLTPLLQLQPGMQFAINGNVGSVIAPFALTSASSPPPSPPPALPPSPPPSPPPVLSITLTTGWNWISFNLELADMSLAAALSNLPLTQGDNIKNQGSFADYYDGYGFFGQLTMLNTDEMYALKLADGTEPLTVSGTPVSLPKTINLVAGWTWLPYPYQTSRPLSDGLPTFQYGTGDHIKSQSSFTDFYESYGWYGTLADLEPGKGYKIKTGSQGTATFQA